MRDLITDLLESERLASRARRAAPRAVDLAALAREVVAEPGQRHAGAAAMTCMRRESAHADAGPHPHAPAAAQPARQRAAPQRRRGAAAAISVQPTRRTAAQAKRWTHRRCATTAPACPTTSWPTWPSPSTAPTAARERATGGVGLGLYLCKLVAQAHGGAFTLRNAEPGLEVSVTLQGG